MTTTLTMAGHCVADSARDRFLRLPDGRRLGYSEHGEPAGRPVFFFHGAPSSRLQHHPDTRIASDLGVRVIVPERPGYGISDAKPDRTLFDWPADVAALADHLGLKRFALAGWSIGGVYALACAHALPDRVERVAVLGGVAPLDAPGIAPDLSSSVALLHLARNSPERFAEAVAPVSGSAEALIQHFLDTVSPSDREAMTEPAVASALRPDVAAALQQGIAGIRSDFVLAAKPWGFDLSEIATAVDLWHGEEDLLIPPAMGRHLAQALPRCRARFCPDEGHMLLYRHWQEMLRVLRVEP